MEAKTLLRDLFSHALNVVEPAALVKNFLTLEGSVLKAGESSFDLDAYEETLLLGSGKAAFPMGEAVMASIGGRISRGILIAPSPGEIKRITVLQADHPVPTRRSADAAKILYDSVCGLGERGFFIYLLSGGSSALIELPAEPLTIEELNRTNRVLLEHALPIESVNCIRKHLSRIKGGGLARAARSPGIVLVLSDVIGDDLGTIGSAPLYYDATTFGDALAIIERSGIAALLPGPVMTRLRLGAAGRIDETPKSPSENIRHFLIGSNRIALESVAAQAKTVGITSRILTDRLSGEASELGRELIRNAKKIQPEEDDLPLLLIYGGEPTVTVRGKGQGGRNQELALAALIELGEQEGITLLSGATDGIDGSSDAAGGIIDAETFRAAKENNIDLEAYLADNDSYHALQRLGSLIMTGYTGTNVMDIILVLIQPLQKSDRLVYPECIV